MTARLYRFLHHVWYGDSGWYRLLLPLSGLYWLVINLRQGLYQAGILPTRYAGVPVIVVGNVTTGGTGKTPTVLWLAQALAARGFRPGIASRGHGGSRSHTSMRVDADSDPAAVGDEPVLLARRSGCPVVVDPDRRNAASMLAADGCDLVIADDGLQHYELRRSYEICVVDGRRGLGNGWLLPAGPLREPIERLLAVDQVLVNGRLDVSRQAESVALQNALSFDLVATEACRQNGSLSRPLGRFAGHTVHAVAAIGNPSRFFELLRGHGIEVIEHAHPDHARLARGDLDFGDGLDVFVTEKDAVKLGKQAADHIWYVPVELEMAPADAGPWLEQIVSRMREEAKTA